MRKVLVLALALLSSPALAQQGTIFGASGGCTTVCTISTSLAIGGATIGSNALAVTGTSNISGNATFGGNLTAATGNIVIGNGSNIQFGALGSGRAVLSSTADATFRVGNTADTSHFLLSVPTEATLQHGAADAAIAVAQTIRVQSIVAGTTAANGANWTMIGSLPTGTGTSGDIILQTGIKTGSGTTQGTATTALTIKGETQRVVANAPITFKGYTVSTLPAGNQGDNAFVTDAVACTFLAAITGGGATFCPVIYNGSAWVGA